MAFLRADTARTMVSRANSTSELSLGVCQVLYDANGQLPDNLEDLEVGFKTQSHTRITTLYFDVVLEISKIKSCVWHLMDPTGNGKGVGSKTCNS